MEFGLAAFLLAFGRFIYTQSCVYPNGSTPRYQSVGSDQTSYMNSWQKPNHLWNGRGCAALGPIPAAISRSSILRCGKYLNLFRSWRSSALGAMLTGSGVR